MYRQQVVEGFVEPKDRAELAVTRLPTKNSSGATKAVAEVSRAPGGLSVYL